MLLSRLSNDDSIEDRLSTFAREMRTMSLILSALDPEKHALVIIDELGRGTSPEEGIGIAHALAEEIIASNVRSFLFFSFAKTHAGLLSLYDALHRADRHAASTLSDCHCSPTADERASTSFVRV